MLAAVDPFYFDRPPLVCPPPPPSGASTGAVTQTQSSLLSW
jgi:hypothetical protein